MSKPELVDLDQRDLNLLLTRVAASNSSLCFHWEMLL